MNSYSNTVSTLRSNHASTSILSNSNSNSNNNQDSSSRSSRRNSARLLVNETNLNHRDSCYRIHRQDDTQNISHYHARWLPSDDQTILDLVSSGNFYTGKAGKISWEDIASRLNGRTATQCRTRWNYKLNPKKRHISDSDENFSTDGIGKRSKSQLSFEQEEEDFTSSVFTINELSEIYGFVTSDESKTT